MTLNHIFDILILLRVEKHTQKRKISMKYKKGQKVIYRKQTWTVCDGGMSMPDKGVYMYRLCRGAWKKLVSGHNITGNCITA